MDPSIDATKDEIPSSEEEETKGLEKKNNHQTTPNSLKPPQSVGDSATAVGSGGAEPSQLTASVAAAEEAGHKEDVGTCPDSTVEEDQKIDSERPDNDGEKFKGQKQESSPGVQDQSRAEDPGTASVAAEETEENEGDRKRPDSSVDGGKISKTQKPPTAQTEPPVQEQPRPADPVTASAAAEEPEENEGDEKPPDSFDLVTASVAAEEQEENEGDKKSPDSSDGEKFKGQKQESSPTVQGVQDQSRAEAGPEEDGLKPPVQPKPPVQEQSRPEGPLYMKMAVLMAGLAVIIGLICFDYSSERPAPRTDSKIDIFHREFEKMKSSFPSQREELWKRSKILLMKHLQMAEPTEPVSMILTAGRRAEGTLRCLATRMAETFSSALGASVLHIDGASRAALESGQVKLDIDEQLGGAFEGNRRSAIIHRFEELPPGSTLIFYRYCDHENAAYKESFLIFTVLLEEEDLKSHLSLTAVEEIVQDHIQDKFLSSTHPASFDRMDVDKFSGLWSRISHLILPVAVEEHMEMQGCEI